MPNANNIQLWKDRYKQAMQEMKPIIMGMGLYIHMRRERKEMIDIIQKVSLAPYLHENKPDTPS
jgi:hypothetical protein